MLFVDRIVGQVREDVFQVTRVVSFRCEASKTLVVDIQTQRVDASQGHIDPEVEFMAVYQHGVVDVLLDYALQPTGDFVK